jgi:NlpC/P60 family putative phage cell wall peptidase
MTNPVTIAREWIDTPYLHQHSLKGVGCDCLGLVRGVWREMHGGEPEAVPSYSPSWGEAGPNEPLIEAASRHLGPMLQVADMRPGDVLIFRIRPGMIAKHCGIYATADSFIHAYQSAGRVTESPMNPWWRDRIVAVFRFPLVEES